MRFLAFFFSIYLLSFCLIPVSSTQAEINTALKVGPRWDHLEFTISPFRGAGFVGSELVFDSTSLFTEGVVTWSDPSHPWFLRGHGGFGQVLTGTSTDSDWFTPGRTNLFSESESDLDGHNILNFGADGGYRVWEDNYYTVYLLGGFAWNQTRYQMVDLVQTQDPFGLFGGTGPIPNHNSEYRARWYGPTLGFHIMSIPFKPLRLAVQLDGRVWPYLWYEGKGVWNLRTDFAQNPSFIQEANGFGGDIQLKVRHFLTSGFVIEAGYSGIFLRADDGTTTIFRSNGTQATTDLLDVSQDANFFHLGLEFIWGRTNP